ncbi:Ca2+-dependent phosphoinositide-specific phospholipase C [Pirellulaceae bacterium SH449]
MLLRSLDVVLFGLLALCGTPTTGLTQSNRAASDESQSVSHNTSERTLRLNEIQMVGTHNSYHIEPDAFTRKVIASTVPREADAIEYTHRPLIEQLDELKMRHFELDLYLDPKGSLFRAPSMWKLAQSASADVPDWPHASDMSKPGTKILHSPDFDYRSTLASLREALELLNSWSNRNPSHVTIFLLLELKSDSFSPLTKPLKWTESDIDQLEHDILSTIPRNKTLTPDDLRAGKPTLRDAVQNVGWPTFESQRGKFVFLLDNEGAERELLLRRSEILEGRLLFASVSPNHPAAAWMKRNDPISQFADIQNLVKQGFLVRTRADADTIASRTNDATRRQKAIESGAQLISTDYPEPDTRFSDYCVKLPFPFEDPHEQSEK